MGMGSWNSKGCRTRVKGFKVQRQKEEVSLAAGLGIRDTEEDKKKSTKDVTVKNYSLKLYYYKEDNGINGTCRLTIPYLRKKLGDFNEPAFALLEEHLP
ncbi:hypothetical protein AVEN_93467-1 [Araneus ventricosus]|uniref:Uncharacterized protein n=1 Tax=Araneus ventricosus TaxID=182803 RepID=A0A4Y2ARR9_ARAVE|nr:hypothetical protein AVEN_93467-1 [Araneus ventricosus]